MLRHFVQRHLLTLTGLSVGLLVAASPAAAQQQTETIDRTVQLPANGTVDLKNFSGRVRITGRSGNDVVIKAVRRAERPQLDGITLAIESSGSTVSIDANRRSAEWNDRDNNVVDSGELDSDLALTMRSTRRRSTSADLPGGSSGRTLRFKTFSGDVGLRTGSSGS